MKNSLKEIKSQYKIIMLVTVLTLICNMTNIINATSSLLYITGTLLASISCILVIEYPILAITSITLAEIFNTVYDTMHGHSLAESIQSSVLTLSITLVVLLTQISYTKQKDKSKSLSEVLKTQRDLINVPLWIKFIFACVVVIVIMKFANSSSMINETNDVYLRVFASASLLIPTIMVFVIITTSTLFYMCYIIYVTIELYTMYELFIRKLLKIDTAADVILDLIILIYILSYRKNQLMKVNYAKEIAEEM